MPNKYQHPASLEAAMIARRITRLLGGAAWVLAVTVTGCGSSLAEDDPRVTELAPYVEFLATDIENPADYVLSLFDDHDVVVLCERWHPEMTQYDFFLEVVSDPRFAERVGHVFTELGARNLQGALDDLMGTPDLGESEVGDRLVPIFRDLGLHGMWDATNFFEFLGAVYSLNERNPEHRITVHFSDVELPWDGLTASEYDTFRSEVLPERDRLMADRVLETLERLDSPTAPAKALVIMNYRHAFNDFTFADGSKGDNTGRYLFEALPGRVANVMLNSVALLPGTTDSAVVAAPIHGGKWDAAFRRAGVAEAGFDFAGSPFGDDAFDYFAFRPHSRSYREVFTGFVFYRPLSEHFLLSGIPGLFDDGFETVFRERLKVMGREIPDDVIREIVAASETPLRETYDDPEAFEAAIASWLPEHRAADFIPLNLDYSRPGLVEPATPWGWWLQPMRWAGIDAEVVAGDLRLARQGSGSSAQAVYDLNASLAGRRLELASSVRGRETPQPRLRIGLAVLGEDLELHEAWSPEDADGELSTSLTVPEDARNVQVLVEYSGEGEAFLAPLRLSVDGRPAGAVAPGQTAPPRSDYEWVREHALALGAVEPGNPEEDLATLRPMIGDARFVLLGESTHGSREFFTLKHRLARWLMESEGFTVFAFEDHMAPARAVDRYLQTGIGRPEEAMRGLFGFWRQQSVRDMLAALRNDIEARTIEMSFVGFDMQVPTGAFEDLGTFAAEHDPSLAEIIETTVGDMRTAWAETRYPQRTPEEYQRWISGARRLLEVVEERAPRYRESAGERPAEWAIYNARLLVQSAEVSASDDIRVRDRFMAENLSWLSARLPPESRIVVWAHNTHVRLDESAMGEHLRALHPGQVVSVGLFTQQGAYRAWDGSAMREYPLFPGPIGSIEELLSSTGHRVAALDLRPAIDDDQKPLSQPLHHRNVGLFAADLGFYRTEMTKGFDVVLFVESTTSTLPLEGD